MKKYQKVIIQDEAGNMEEYEQAILLTCNQEDKVSISLVHSAAVNVVRAALALITFADQMYYLEDFPVTKVECQILE